MLKSCVTYRILLLLFFVMASVGKSSAFEVTPEDTVTTRMGMSKAQRHRERTSNIVTDSTFLNKDAVSVSTEDSVKQMVADGVRLTLDSLTSTMEIEPKLWMPNPNRALWLAIVFPGGGQIYNRKYWKLPIFYGGFIGCLYAMNWNNTMYRDYSQAYMDIMDDDPNTHSYTNFLPPSYDVKGHEDRLKSLFKRKKDFYRRYRDLSIFCMIGVYALSVLDAYIDAELSSFDISRDLSMKVRPSIINDQQMAVRGNPYRTNCYGVQCSLHF